MGRFDPAKRPIANRPSVAGRTNSGTPNLGNRNVAEARRLRSLEDEKSRLNNLLAEALLDNAVLQDLASIKW